MWNKSEKDRRYIYEKNENSENRNKDKMEINNLGKKPSCITFGKGIPIIPGYKKHGLRGSLW